MRIRGLWRVQDGAARLRKGMIAAARSIMARARALHANRHLAWQRLVLATKRSGSLFSCRGYAVRIHDVPYTYLLYKDSFVRRIYHFEAHCRDPLILDCGSNIGMSVLYFKSVYPHARIIGFEPDPAVFPYLRENVDRNRLLDVTLVQAALASQEGQLLFFSDGTCGSCLAGHAPDDVEDGRWVKHQVPCVRLRDYLIEPIDFLKMNIESAEWEVLADSEDRLRQIREMVIEYHHLPGLARTLHDILALLHRQGFAYLIHDFDAETNPGSVPPFRLAPDSRYWLLIYAKRLDAHPSGDRGAAEHQLSVREPVAACGGGR